MLSEFLVLNTGDILPLFHKHVREFGKPVTMPEDLLQELLACMENRYEADQLLDTALNNMMDSSFEYDYDRGISYNYYEHVDAPVVAFALGLAAVILQQLDMAGAYSPMGTLAYTYQPTREDYHRIVMRRKDVPATRASSDSPRHSRWV